MPATTKKRRKIVANDINEWATKVVEAATGVTMPKDLVERERRLIAAEKAAAKKAAAASVKNAAAVALGRLGGLKGGRARAEALTPEQRSEIAKKAAGARWQRESKATRYLLLQKMVRLHQKGYTLEQIIDKLALTPAQTRRLMENNRLTTVMK